MPSIYFQSGSTETEYIFKWIKGTFFHFNSFLTSWFCPFVRVTVYFLFGVGSGHRLKASQHSESQIYISYALLHLANWLLFFPLVHELKSYRWSLWILSQNQNMPCCWSCQIIFRPPLVPHTLLVKWNSASQRSDTNTKTMVKHGVRHGNGDSPSHLLVQVTTDPMYY